MEITILVPIIIFIVTSFVLYSYSKDPEKKTKPVKFILPGIIISLLSYFGLKYKDNLEEPVMQGSYFD
jgi:hypothetical protein